MKKINLLRAISMLLFSVIVLYGCREESTFIEKETLKAKISYKKFSDLPFLKNTVEKVEKEFIRVNTIPNSGGLQVEAIAPSELSIDQEANVVEMALEDGGTMYTLLLDSNVYNLQTGYVVENLNVIVNSDNTESYFLAKYESTNGQPFYDITDFNGTVTYTDLGGNVLGGTTISGGEQIESQIEISIGCHHYVLNNNAGFWQVQSVADTCNEGGTGDGGSNTGGGATGGSNDGGYTGGGYTGSGAGGGGGGTYSGSTPTVSAMPNIPSEDYVEIKKHQYFVSTLTTERKTFLVNNVQINDMFFYYLRDNFFSSASSTFVKWGINFCMQNPNTTKEQFQNWFMGQSEGQDGEGYDSAYWDNPNLTFPQQSLPTWTAYYNAYPHNADGSGMVASEVYEMIGGDIYQKHINSATSQSYQNACALRVSRALNYSGVNIPAIKGTMKGGDGKNYFLTARALNIWMRKTFGVSPTNPNHFHYTKADGGINGQNFPKLLEGKKGIFSLVSPLGSSWATGHADTLQDNSTCINSCHFYDGDIDYIDIWVLN